MLARIRKAMDEKDQGFTLIELLVVMIIIGILAAIAIPTFLNQRNKGYDTQAKSDVRAIQTEIETYFTDNQQYPTSVAAGTGSDANTVYFKQSATTSAPTLNTPTDRSKYCASVTSKSGAVWKVSSAAAGVTKGACVASDIA